MRYTTDKPKEPGWYWCRNQGDVPGTEAEFICRVDRSPRLGTLYCSWMTAAGEAGILRESEWSPDALWSGPIPTPGELVKSAIDSMPELANVPFVFWTCPNGCNGVVAWNDEKSDATCMSCGRKKSEGTPLLCANTGCGRPATCQVLWRAPGDPVHVAETMYACDKCRELPNVVTISEFNQVTEATQCDQ